MSDGPFLVSSWQQFLPPNAVVMARRTEVVRFQFEAPGLERADHRELFDKILAALNLMQADYQIVEESAPALGTRIRFVASEGENVGDSVGPSVVTYSLSAMLKNPGLKKAVWAQLKSAVTK